MVTEVSDLEPLLGRFDPGLILIGPLIFTYRYFDIAGNESKVFHPDLIIVGPLSFDIAGNASKVYEIVDLGFGKVETNASGQRAKFIEKLESRFAEVMTFGSRLEMANAAHEHWPNEETAKVLGFTAKVLAFAGEATKSEPTKAAGQHGDIDDNSFPGALRRDCGKPFVDAREPADDAKHIAAVSKYPREQLGGDPAPTQRQQHSSPSEDEIARGRFKVGAVCSAERDPKGARRGRSKLCFDHTAILRRRRRYCTDRLVGPSPPRVRFAGRRASSIADGP